MRITMMTRWNIPCGVSLHAELIGREWVRMGHELNILAPVEIKDYRYRGDESYVRRCYTLREYRGREAYFFDPEPFLNGDHEIFVVQNLEILPMEDLFKIFPSIRKKAKTVFVVHEGRPPRDKIFYEFDWDAVVCFDERYKNFLRDIYRKDRVRIIPYPCHPIRHGDRVTARMELGLPLDKRVIFNYGIGVYRHLHLLPTIEKVSERFPLILLTITHIDEWYDLFDAVRGRYRFIELRKGTLAMDKLYTYLHASDCLLVHKDSAEAVVVPSTVYLCLGAGRPILAYDTNFFTPFDKEVLKYSSLSDALEDVFEERENVKTVLMKAEEYVRRNSSFEVAKRFIDLFEEL